MTIVVFPTRLSSLLNTLESAINKYINGVTRNYRRRVNTDESFDFYVDTCLSFIC